MSPISVNTSEAGKEVTRSDEFLNYYSDKIHINTLLIPLILCALNSIKSTSNIDVVVFTTVVEQGKIFFFRPQFHQVSI